MQACSCMGSACICAGGACLTGLPCHVYCTVLGCAGPAFLLRIPLPDCVRCVCGFALVNLSTPAYTTGCVLRPVCSFPVVAIVGMAPGHALGNGIWSGCFCAHALLAVLLLSGVLGCWLFCLAG